MKPLVFVSHTHESKSLAAAIRKEISTLLSDKVRFFVSSDRSSIVGGDKWLDKIDEALSNSTIVLVLCDRDSINRPWVNFEAGGAWVSKKRVIPLCFGGLTPSGLPQPLASLQALDLSNADDLRDLVKVIAQEAGFTAPKFDSKLIAKRIRGSINKRKANSRQGSSRENSENISTPLAEQNLTPEHRYTEISDPGNQPRKNNIIKGPAHLHLSYKTLLANTDLHKYSLLGALTLDVPPTQGEWLLKLFWPVIVRVVQRKGFEEGKERRIENVRYAELILHGNGRIWPGETVDAIGPNCLAELEYEIDDEIFYDLEANPINLLYKVFLEDHPPLEDSVPFKNLNKY